MLLAVSGFKVSIVRRMASAASRLSWGLSDQLGYRGFLLASKMARLEATGVVLSFRLPAGAHINGAVRQWTIVEYWIDNEQVKSPYWLSQRPFFVELAPGVHQIRAEGSYTARNPEVEVIIESGGVLLVEIFPEKLGGDRPKIVARSGNRTVVASDIA